MASYRCYNCRRMNTIADFHEWEGDRPQCPKCGRADQVVELVAIHFLVPDPRGPILGHGGNRFRVACEPTREYLALSTMDNYSATGDPRQVNCRSCQGVKEWREMGKLYAELRQVLLDEDAGCCG